VLRLSVDQLLDLYAAMAWSDATVWEAVRSLDGAPIDARLRDTLLHLHVVQGAFLAVWTNRPVSFPTAADFPTLGSLQRLAESYHREVTPYLRSLDEGALERPVVMPWVDEFARASGRTFARPILAETCYQVVSHSRYHLGQANGRLRELGVTPPLVDYIAWVWFGRPQPRWPATGQT
jgi:uncharacterized damage-inducible protein DinB